MFYEINGYTINPELDPGQIVGLVVDAAEGLTNVPNIAAVLKDWAQPFATPTEWVEDDETGGQGRHHRDW